MNTRILMMPTAAALVLMVAGCGGIFNPYKSDFQCPMGDKGKCVSVTEAMKETVKPTQIVKSAPQATDKETKQLRDEASYPADSRDIYQQEVAKKLTEFIRQPNTPLVAPPQVMRVLVLPYNASPKELYSERYIYYLLDEPRFVLSVPKYGTTTGDMILEKNTALDKTQFRKKAAQDAGSNAASPAVQGSRSGTQTRPTDINRQNTDATGSGGKQ